MTRVLITGTNRGIGLEFVRQYASEGGRVFATCRHPESALVLNDIAARYEGRVSVHRLDVTNDASIDDLAATIKGEPVDILINNAGLGAARVPHGQIDYALWEELFRVNTMGPLRVARAFHANLMEAGTRKVITITSTLGSIALNHVSNYPYGASKAAVNRVMRSLAAEWRNDRFIVVAMHPGWVKTDMGGPHASLDVDISVAGMRKIIGSLTQTDNGRFLDYRGEEIPW